MTLDITVDNDAEVIVIVLDDHKVLRAIKGETEDDLELNKGFRDLEEEDEILFQALKDIAARLFVAGS